MKNKSNPNALINETSPYLLQHAYNPVQWYPWSDQAIERARQEDKPILLSIGYSACHWCHVMAHESFEDEATAEIMNKHFINIKVDREERPDIDKIYQTAQQLLSQRSGGWPLTMVLSPDDHVPFFGGTYFPPQTRHGLPGFRELLMRIAELYENEKQAVKKQNLAVRDALKQIQEPAKLFELELDSGPISQGIEEMLKYSDRIHGGFGGAPKFPQAPSLEFLLSSSNHVNAGLAKSSMQMVNLSLSKMAAGGIYDHLGGGFCRYTVDEYWLIPHFEKMLYDNGPLLFIYAQAWKLSGNENYQQVARETAEWIMRDMQSSEGGYYSSLDADSEAEEGRFYVWSQDEVKQILNEQEYDVFAKYYGLDNAPNFEGRWHLHIDGELVDVSQGNGQELQPTDPALLSAKEKLLKTRNNRIWPGRDEKILTSWNALAIKGMSMAALRLDNETYLQSATRALDFLHNTMWKNDRLSASYKDGKSHLNAYLDDYVYLIDALLTMLAVQWDSKWMNFAMQLASVLMQQFYDQKHGGFYFTSHDHEALLQRRRDFMDDAIPSGNGVAVRVLLQLGHLTGNHEFMDAAEQTLRAAWQSLQDLPHAHASFLTSLCHYNYPERQVILRGNMTNLKVWQNRCYDAADDIDTRVYAIPEDAVDLPGLLAERIPVDTTIAYICEGFVCREPIINLDQLISDLKLQALE